MDAYPNLTDEQRAALVAFADRHQARGQGWKEHLCDLWLDGGDASEPMGNYLRQVRNQFGPTWLLDVYAMHWLPELPQWERVGVDAAGIPLPSTGKARWMGYDDPPAIGVTVTAKVNSLGDGVVTGYFVEHDYLGVIVRLGEDRPDWHIEQRKGDPMVHLFGPEIMAADEIKLARWGLRITPLDSFQKGVMVIRAFTGAPSMTPEEINAKHAEIKAGLQKRVADYLKIGGDKMGGPDAWVIYDPHADEEGWLLSGPRAGIVAESVEFHESMHG
jgi:hypothetical protein